MCGLVGIPLPSEEQQVRDQRGATTKGSAYLLAVAPCWSLGCCKQLSEEQQHNRFEGLPLGSQDQTLVLTVAHVPSSLDSYTLDFLK